ncbi:hypothetical protein ACIBL6_47600 [Streptomyces sp. NPDC050400]|uniref:hypothetical protein n=1 Tax=Streptomyces sp. NPDC050400 TaxID=3365610 RepID=UPI0037A6FC6C
MDHIEQPEQSEPASALDEILTPDEDGHALALHDAADISATLLEQTDRAYREAITARAEHAIDFENELSVQPGLFDLRGDVLDGVLYLEGVLTAARGRRLRPELIERLEAAVDHGHDLIVLLAECAITTAQPSDA